MDDFIHWLNEQDLNNLKANYLGKKSRLSEIMSTMRELSIEKKKDEIYKKALAVITLTFSLTTLSGCSEKNDNDTCDEIYYHVHKYIKDNMIVKYVASEDLKYKFSE